VARVDSLRIPQCGGRAMTAQLEVRNVSHRFGGLEVLKGVTFDVVPGSITGLIGPNGAGKSTLFNIISGFLRPTAGDIVFRGEIATAHPIQRRSRDGLLRTFQTPRIFRDLTVWENLIVGCHMLGRTGVVAGLLAFPAVRRELKEAGERAEKILGEFELTGIRDVLAGEIPAGRQRMVELARAVMAGPTLLCLDEPSSGLSAAEVQGLMLTLRKLNQSGMTILLVSHDMELMGISDSIHALCFGEIIASGNLAYMQSSLRVREAYLGV
jgi:branched-chain amino acid transport system ATP-binding protein/nonpolar-amino-acid-transporting ATPase